MTYLADMAEVVRSVRTPLGLAALALLLGAPLLRQVLLRRGKPSEDSKAIVRNVFIFGLVVSVLAISSTVYSDWLNREVRISGLVRDETGAGVPFASVLVPGRDGGTTQADGSFAFTVAGARAANTYGLEVSKEGFEPASVTLQGSHPDPISVILKRITFSNDAIVRLPDNITLRHNLGLPQVELAIFYANPYPKKIAFQDISLTLTSPTGTVIPMRLELIMLAPGAPGPPLNSWEVDRGTTSTVTYSFFNEDVDFVQLQQRVFDEIAPQQSSIKGPDPTVRLLSDGLVKNLRDHFTTHFVYAPGKWLATLHYRVDGRSVDRHASFKLAEETIVKMRAIEKYYSSGLGVVPNWRFWQSEDANPTVVAALSED